MGILLMGDTKGSRALTKSQLAAAGISAVAEASNASEAIGLLKADPSIGLMVIDSADPVSGISRVRNDAEARQVPMVVLSHATSRATILACMKAGAGDYILKPATPEVLKSRLEAAQKK